jgi:hypothetical protein
MKKINISILFITLMQSAFSQKEQAVNKTTRVTIKKEIDKTPNLKVAFLGSIIYPGFRVAVEFPMYGKEKIITKPSGRIKNKVKVRFVVANLSMYYHPNFHKNFMFSAEWLMRKTRGNGWFTEWAPGLGYSRTFIGGDAVYTVDDKDVVIQQYFSGYNYIMLSIGGGLGYDFMVKKQKQLKLYARSSLMFYAPFNSFIYPRPAVEIGAIIKLLKLFKK